MTGHRVVRWLRLPAVSTAVVWLGVWSGARSILDSRVRGPGAYRRSQTYDKDQNRKNARRPSNRAGLMASGEAGALEERIAQYRKKTGTDVAVVATCDDGSHTAREYADDSYDQNDLDTGRKASGILFLIYTDSPGSYGGESYVSTTGDIMRIPTDWQIEQIQDDVVYLLRDFDYTGAAAELPKDVEHYVDRGIQRGQYNYDAETGEISIYRSIRWYEGTLALLVSAGVAGPICLGVKRRYSMEQTGRERANSLLAYQVDTKSALGGSGDNLIRRFITSVSIPRPTQDHSPGGSGQSSRRSSTRRSSSGRNHRGGDRRFQRDIKCVLCTS